MSAKRPQLLAASEDEPIAWYERSSCSRLAAIRECANDWSMRPWRLYARVEHMRPFSEADCPAEAHGTDGEGELLDDNCRCWREEEGWHYVCKTDHPDAIAVWRIEALTAPSWWRRFRRFTTKLHPAVRRAYKPVLWGGRLERRANRFDRILLRRGHVVLAGSSQIRLDRGCVQWCPTCRMETLHSVTRWEAEPNSPVARRRKARDSRRCEAEGHYERLEEAEKPRWRAPMATDIREAS